MKPEVLLLFCFLAILPALWTIAHGEANIKTHDVPTPDKELKANEKVGSKTDDEVIQREEEKINPDGFSVQELKLLEQRAEKHVFQAEVNKLMNIIINSLYSSREVFLRELISNASDALDKIRFLSLTDKTQLESQPKLEIKIKADKENNSIHITDTGVGMTKEELRSNLGTIAKSGTTEFLEKVGSSGDTSSLIGQFGVGFYSAFLIADTVTVVSKSNNDNQAVWTSDANGAFTVAEDPRGNTLGRGTEIILHLKEDASDFLDPEKLKFLVTKYSEFINFPIYLWASHEEENQVPLTAEEKEAKKKEKTEEDEEEVNLEEEKQEETEEEEFKTVKETVWNWDLMNEIKPIWTRNPKDITDDEYNSFYKAFSKETEDPLIHIHFNAEGEVDFKSLLYIPTSPPKNMFDPSSEGAHKGIKLYVRRVFITDEFKDILPKYLSFIKGIVDSDDLPLNVSRETLQEHKTLKLIKKKLVRKAIAMFQQLADEEDNTKYLDFWKNFGTNVKLGVVEDPNNRTRLSKLLMFHSSKTKELTTLDKYVERMKKGQQQIYYLAGENKESIENSPLIEKLLKRGYEVLYMVDPIDEYCLGNLGEKFDGKYKVTNVAREQLKLDDEDVDQEKEKEIEKDYEPLLKFLKKNLSKRIEKAIISKRLAGSPSALVSGSYGWTPNMERIIKAQALGDAGRLSQTPMMQPRKILEINVRHPIIKELKKLVDANEEDKTAQDISHLLYETAALSSGWSLEDPAQFAERIVKMMNLGLNLDANASAEEEPEPIPKAEEPEETQDEEEHTRDEL